MQALLCFNSLGSKPVSPEGGEEGDGFTVVLLYWKKHIRAGSAWMWLRGTQTAFALGCKSLSTPRAETQVSKSLSLGNLFSQFFENPLR